MAQEIVRVCDPCLVENGTRVDAAVVVLDLGAGPRAVDLCEAHQAELVKPLADAVDLWGVKPDPVPGKVKAPRKPRQQAAAAADGSTLVESMKTAGSVYACPWCDFEVNARTAFQSHAKRTHGVSSVMRLIGTTCPVCGEVHSMAGPTNMDRHVKRVHGLASLSWAVRAARAIGDPFGVDARVRAAVDA